MMRIIIAFLVLLASILIGIQLNKDPGYVLITINHWIIESTVWFSIFSLLLVFLIIHIVLQFASTIAHIPSAIHEWNDKRLAHKAQEITKKGLIEYSEGKWHKAKNHLIQAIPNSETPLLNYLTAAQAAQKMGDSELRDQYLQQAQESMPEAKIAVELTQAQLQLANHQWAQALETLKQLQHAAPRHPYVLKLQMTLYKEMRDWSQLIPILPLLKKNHCVSGPEFELLEQDVYLQAIRDLIPLNNPEAVTALFQALPKSLTQDPEIIATYARFLLDNHQIQAAELLLKRSLRKEFNPQLMALYAHLPGTAQQLHFAESLLKKTPNSQALFLCLGQLCLAQHLWGKAKYYLEQSIELNPTPTAYLFLGQLHEQLNEPLLACEHYKKGLLL